MADQLGELRPKLVDQCSEPILKDILDDLEEKKILSRGEVEEINANHHDRGDKVRLLVDIVKKKGDKASNTLIQSLSIRDPVLSEDLGITAPSLPAQQQNIQTPSQTDDNGITLCSKKEYDRICTNKEEFYSILPREERTRLALIICNDKFNDCKLTERHGAKYDVEGMKKLLSGLGYEVQITSNLTVEGMKDTMTKFAADEKHKSSDSTFLVFMSHGFRDVICATDTKITSDGKAKDVLHVDEIFTAFNNVNCQALQNKPKVIIIQACRGNKNSRVLQKDGLPDLPEDSQEQLEVDAIQWIHTETDFICFCSSTPDTFSIRNAKSGSPFIQRLIEHTKNEAHDSSINKIFRRVKKSFGNGCQMPTIERDTLQKEFYLFPGH